MRKSSLAAVALGVALSGCVPALVRNRSEEPGLKPPARYAAQPVAVKAVKADADPFGRASVALFASPALRKLVDEALAHNQELNIRFQELVVARAEVSGRRGEYLPKLRAGATAGVDRVGAFTSRGVNDEGVGLPATMGDFGFGLIGSWEVDAWGKLRDEASSAEFRYRASVEARRFMVTQLVAELARSYYELLAIDAKLEVLRRNIALQARALVLIRVEKQAARVTELAVQRFEAEVAKYKSVLYETQQARVQTENRINFLVGRYPQPVTRQVAELKAPLPTGLKAGLPSELLENRPDVRQAELELGAAKLDVSAARKAFFPALSLDAKLGLGAFNPAHLLDPGSIVGGLAGSLSAPLLNRAAIEAQYQSADARQLQALIRYEQSVLQAVTDVTTQLANLDNIQASYDTRAQQVARLEKSVEMSMLLFRAARADYVEVLLTRRDLLEAEIELIERRMQLRQAVVGLYQALGGGWREDRAKG